MRFVNARDNKDQHQYKFYTLLFSTYCVLTCLTIVAGSRTIPFPIPFDKNLTVFGGTFVLPIMFSIQDIVTEVYGYEKTIRMIKWSLVNLVVFIGFMELITHLPTPSSNIYHDTQYKDVFTPLWRHVLALTVGLFVGGKLNSYLLDKWKKMLKGKKLWARLLGSSAIGEITLQMIVSSIGWIGTLSFSAAILPYVFISYCIKLFFTTLTVPVIYIITYWLKSEEDLKENYEVFEPKKMVRSVK
jgi:uncharacterized integral membrane protein (TIGR00697 family)